MKQAPTLTVAAAVSASHMAEAGSELLGQIQQLLATTPNVDPYEFLVAVSAGAAPLSFCPSLNALSISPSLGVL
jgi:hypothetical protein